jgi:hypothetical protein
MRRCHARHRSRASRFRAAQPAGGSGRRHAGRPCRSDHRRISLPRDPLRGASCWWTALAPTAAGCALERGPDRSRLRRVVPASGGTRLVRPRRADERGLPRSQCVHTGTPEQPYGCATGDGLAARRRLRGRQRPRLRRTRTRPQGRGGGHTQLPPRSSRLSRASRPGRRVAARQRRQLRAAGSDRGTGVGAEQHPRVRRRSHGCHELRRVGWLVLRGCPAGLTAPRQLRDERTTTQGTEKEVPTTRARTKLQVQDRR